jgi:hypothetical protein
LKEQTTMSVLLKNWKLFITVKGNFLSSHLYKNQSSIKIFCNSTTLLSEPVLGGKKVDLYKLYQEVVTAGGFDQVNDSYDVKEFLKFNYDPILGNKKT